MNVIRQQTNGVCRKWEPVLSILPSKTQNLACQICGQDRYSPVGHNSEKERSSCNFWSTIFWHNLIIEETLTALLDSEFLKVIM